VAGPRPPSGKGGVSVVHFPLWRAAGRIHFLDVEFLRTSSTIATGSGPLFGCRPRRERRPFFAGLPRYLTVPLTSPVLLDCGSTIVIHRPTIACAWGHHSASPYVCPDLGRAAAAMSSSFFLPWLGMYRWKPHLLLRRPTLIDEVVRPCWRRAPLIPKTHGEPGRPHAPI